MVLSPAAVSSASGGISGASTVTAAAAATAAVGVTNLSKRIVDWFDLAAIDAAATGRVDFSRGSEI
jgi:hypothetical protein